METAHNLCLAGFALVGLVSAANRAPAFSEDQLTLAEGGRTDYVIVCSPDAAPAEQYAAQELSHYLREITGARFSVTGRPAANDRRIVVGPNVVSRPLVGEKTAAALGPEEFVIRSVGRDLVLLGGRPRGTLYAVYHFLDNILGVRWWAPNATYVPKKAALTLKPLSIRAGPQFEYRSVFTTTAWDPDWAARNRLNDRVLVKANGTPALKPPDEKHGGGRAYGERFVHTFDQYIPASEHFEAHPEWFSLVNGKRVGGQYQGQLCLSNPEALELMVKQVRADLENKPGTVIISVSQNDNANGCRCEACAKIDEEEGSQAGSLIRFVNAVAERIEKDFPNAAIDTLAYLHTQRPPKLTRPRRNVIVRLCDIRCSFAQPLQDSQSVPNQSFVEDLKAWSGICNRLYIWDYITNFRNYLNPHPNLRVLGPNVRLFASQGVKGVFEQGSYRAEAAEFMELRSWVLSRLLWDPQQDDAALMEEFLNGYYGKAGPIIRQYIDLLHSWIPARDYHLSISGDSEPSPVINAETMIEAEKLFARAEAAVAGRPEVLNRVRRAHVPVRCMWLMNYDEYAAAATQQGWQPLPASEMLAEFRKQLDADKVTIFGEGRPISQLLRLIENKVTGSITTQASNSFASCSEDAFDGDPATGWNGGSFGPEWVQKDLGKLSKIKSIRSVFSLPSLYNSVTYRIEVSVDGEVWRPAVAETMVKANAADDALSPPIEARYVRTTVIRATSPTHPDGEWVCLNEQTIQTE